MLSLVLTFVGWFGVRRRDGGHLYIGAFVVGLALWACCIAMWFSL